MMRAEYLSTQFKMMMENSKVQLTCVKMILHRDSTSTATFFWYSCPLEDGESLRSRRFA